MPVQTESADVARSWCQQAAQLYEEADYHSARNLYERALGILERLLGSRHPDTARCLHGLGQVHMRLGDDALARQLLERALAIQEVKPGRKHPDTAATLHTLGELRSNLGDLQTGLDLMERAYRLRERALGSSHPDTLESMAILGLMLAQQGDRRRAEGLLARALSLCEAALGEDHRTTARVLNGLGRLYAADRATYSRARALYERALATYERLLGPDHPQTALVLSNLAAVLSDMEDYDAALPLLVRSLAVHEQVYGPDDWRTSFVLVNLADTHSRRGEPGAARPLLERALIIRERAWGGRHPETVRSLRKLVTVLGNLHTLGDEEALRAGMAFYPCLTSLERASGGGERPGPMMPGAHLDPEEAARRLHDLVEKLAAQRARQPHTPEELAKLEAAGDLARQADDAYQQGDYAATALGLEGALRLQEQVLGQHHLDHVPLLRKLAAAREREGRYSAVLPLIERAAAIHVQVLGPDHPNTLQALSALMFRLGYEYGIAASQELQEQIVQSMSDSLGAGDPYARMVRETHQRLEAMLREHGLDQVTPGASISERREAALAALPAEEEGPLAGLQEIDWHSLQHAYGPADDVPNLLRLLLAADEGVRDSAWEELYGNIWHQGDVYQATSYAVPFLLRMLDSEEARDKQGILAFLEAVATGGPYLTERHTWMEKTLSEQGRDFQTEIERAQSYARRAHEAASQGLDRYLGYLNHPLPDVRRAAARLLCAFPEHSRRAVPALEAQIGAEPDSGLKSELIEYLDLYLAEI